MCVNIYPVLTLETHRKIAKAFKSIRAVMYRLFARYGPYIESISFSKLESQQWPFESSLERSSIINRAIIFWEIILLRGGRAWNYATRHASVNRRETAGCSTGAPVHRFSRYLAPALIKPIHRRRRRSKPVSYGGPLNTGWRVKSVVKIINGSSARAFALSPIDGATAGCIRQRGHNTQRSAFLFPSSFFFVLLLSSLFLPSKWRASNISFSFFFY